MNESVIWIRQSFYEISCLVIAETHLFFCKSWKILNWISGLLLRWKHLRQKKSIWFGQICTKMLFWYTLMLTPIFFKGKLPASNEFFSNHFSCSIFILKGYMPTIKIQSNLMSSESRQLYDFHFCYYHHYHFQYYYYYGGCSILNRWSVYCIYDSDFSFPIRKKKQFSKDSSVRVVNCSYNDDNSCWIFRFL